MSALRVGLLLALALLAGCSDRRPDLKSLMAGAVRIIAVDAAGTRRGAGSGIIIDGKGHVVTSLAIIAKATALLVVPPGAAGTAARPARLVWSSKAHDLALLSVAGLRGDPAVIASVLPKAGADLFLIGYADGPCCGDNKQVAKILTGAMGRVIKLPRAEGGAPVAAILHSIAIPRGDAGGALLDSCGAVVGIASLALDPSETSAKGIHFGTPISALTAGLKAAGVSVTTVDKPCRDR